MKELVVFEKLFISILEFTPNDYVKALKIILGI